MAVIPLITGLFWWTWLIRQMSPSISTLQLFTATFWVGRARVPVSTEILVGQGHPDEPCLLLPGTKTFLPLFSFFMAFSVYRNSPRITYKTKSWFYSGKTHPGSSVSFSLGSISFYPLSKKNYSRHLRTFFFFFESDSLLSIVSWWNPKGIKGRQANEIHKAAKNRKHSL